MKFHHLYAALFLQLLLLLVVGAWLFRLEFGSTSRATRIVNTLRDLRQLSTESLPEGHLIRTEGYHAPGDGGGGLFILEPASAKPDNNGTFIAPASGAGRWRRELESTFPVRAFGARGDNKTDDSVAIQAAIDAAIAASRPKGTAATVEFAAVRHFIGRAGSALVVAGPVRFRGNGTVLRYEGQGTALDIRAHDVVLEDLSVSNSYTYAAPMANLNGTGISFVNSQFFRVRNVKVEGFATGMAFVGEGAGCSYGDVWAPAIINCRIGLSFVATAEAKSFCTHIRVVGGTITHGPFGSKAGSRNISIVENGRTADGIVFYGLGCEGNPERRIYCEGNHCGFHDLYYDGTNGGIDIELAPQATENIFQGGANLDLQRFLDRGKNNLVVDPKRKAPTR